MFHYLLTCDCIYEDMSPRQPGEWVDCEFARQCGTMFGRARVVRDWESSDF